jgi:phospholipid/cholesterol/gamma-HCH transport system substrate-binding protein
MGSATLRWRRRVQGLALLVVVALFVAFTIAVYDKILPWQKADTVTLHVSRIGNELAVPADVKLRGVLVGRVSAASTTGQVTTLTLKIAPNQMSKIPTNVVARILPKTLFGEKYVQLVPPSQPSRTTFKTIADEGRTPVIHQDDSHAAIELQTVFTNLVPLLHTLNPTQLSYTLTAVSEALSGRGNELGASLVRTGQYIGSLNSDLPTIEHDISALADVANNYNDAAPDLLATLRNVTKTAETFTEKSATYKQFLIGATGLAVEGDQVLTTNGQNLVNLADISVPVLDLYSKYSVTLECLANGLAIYDRSRLESVFNQGPYLHITLTPVNDRGTYTTNDDGHNDTPSYNDYADPGRSPESYCEGLPYGNNALSPNVAQYPVGNDYVSAHEDEGGLLGSGGSTGANPLTSLLGDGTTSSSSSSSSSTSGLSLPSGTTGGVGSPSESSAIQSMLGSSTNGGTSTGAAGLDDLLLGPMVRGMAVSK